MMQLIKAIMEKTGAQRSRKTALALIGAVAALAPGVAFAANECGPVSSATNPQSVTCSGIFNPYAGGITYDESTYPIGVQGNLQVLISPTAAVNTTTATGVTGKGAQNFSADVQVQAGSSITSSFEGVRAFTPGSGTASVENYSAVTAATNGLDVYSTTGLASVTNASTASVTVSGSGALAGVTASGATVGLSNAGTVSINASTGSGNAYGLMVSGLSASGASSATNTGTVTVTGGAGAAFGLGSSFTSVGSVTLANSGTLTVKGGAGGAAGFLVETAGAVTITDTAALTVSSTAGPNFGAYAISSGSSGAMTINLTSVSLAGPGAAVQANNGTTGSSASAITIQSVTMTGASGIGVSGSASTSGAATITLGSITGATRAGGVSTTGSNSYGVAYAGGLGLLTLNNNNLISTTGASSPGIYLASTGGGVTVNSYNVTTAGASTDAIDITSSGASPVSINLADGGTTSSATGNGVSINTGGTAAINIGATASTASVSGGLWGVTVTATGGTTLNVAGSVTGGGGAAISVAGGNATINNAGTINGYLTLAAANDTVNNTGTWNAFGASTTFGGGADVVNNSGVLNINPSVSTAATMTFTKLTTLNNAGVISLQGVSGAPHTGDVFNIGGAAYVGSGAAKVLIDANLSTAAVTVSGAQTADQLVTTGAVSGVTTLAVRDLGAGAAGRLNYAGIKVVSAGSSAAGAFVLQGGTIDKGYVQYQLLQAGANYYLVGLPGSAAFQVARTSEQAQRFWRESGDYWAEQMRTPGLAGSQGPSVWVQAGGGSDTERSRPTYNIAAVSPVTLTPDTDIQDNWTGAQAGLDYGMGPWGVGFTAGVGQQTGRFKSNSATLDLNGFNVGAYARYQEGGLFLDALVKYDSYTVKQDAAAFNVGFNGSTTGAELQAGYHYVSGALFIEPVASVSFTGPSLQTFNSSVAGAQVAFSGGHSAYASAGVRVGETQPYGVWTVQPYAGAYVEGEMSANNSAIITTGAQSQFLGDPRQASLARFELGVIGKAPSGLELSAKVGGETGGTINGVDGKVGLTWRW